MSETGTNNSAHRFRDRARRTQPRIGLTPGRVTVRGYARCIGTTEATIRLWITNGMPSYRVGHHLEVHPDEADAWAQKHRAKSVAMFRSGFVYFAERKDGAIKIGYSSSVERRVPVLRANGRRVGATLLLAVDGDLRLEGILHEMFAEERIEGEWFRGDGAVRLFVDKLVSNRRGKGTMQ